MTKKHNNKNWYCNIITYIILFFFTWTIYEMGVVPYLKDNFINIVYIYLAFFIKLIIWVLPVMFYLYHFDKVNIFSYLKLRGNIKEGLIGVLIAGAIFLVYNYLRIIMLGNLSINLNLDLNKWLNTVIMAGFAEEIVFRGFILRKLWERMSFKKAMLLTSFLFLFIHYPLWQVGGKFIFPGIIFSSLYVLIVGVIMAYLYKKTESLWSCIVGHSLHNLIVTILILV